MAEDSHFVLASVIETLWQKEELWLWVTIAAAVGQILRHMAPLAGGRLYGAESLAACRESGLKLLSDHLAYCFTKTESIHETAASNFLVVFIQSRQSVPVGAVAIRQIIVPEKTFQHASQVVRLGIWRGRYYRITRPEKSWSLSQSKDHCWNR